MSLVRTVSVVAHSFSRMTSSISNFGRLSDQVCKKTRILNLSLLNSILTSPVIGYNKLNDSVQWNGLFCFCLRTVITFCFVLFSFLQKLDIIPRKPKRLREDQIISQNFSQNIWIRGTLWTRLDISLKKRW